MHPYLELKLAWQIFQKAPDALVADEQSRLQDMAARQDQLERRILSSPEALHVVIPAATLENRLTEIRQRYEDTATFEQDLQRSGLNADSLRDAVERDLRVEAVLEKVAASVTPATETDAEIYYRLNPKAFDQPEIRTLRHILVTWDSEADRVQAENLLNRLRTESAETEAFAKAALRYSQCPTATEGGVLGRVKRGQLYAELEAVAFALDANTVSEVTASPIGLHIVRCDAIEPGGLMPFASVCERIVERLNDQRRGAAQRAWIKQLTPLAV